MKNNFSNRVFKKHSVIMAKLALKSGIIKPDFFNGLYLESYRRKKNKKRGYSKYNIKIQYYTELYYSSVDYWGECDEHSLISYIFDVFFWDLVTYESETNVTIYPKKFPRNNISLIKELRDGVQQSKLQRGKSKQLHLNRINLSCKRSRKNKILRLKKYHY